jgi:hypothetical protein
MILLLNHLSCFITGLGKTGYETNPQKGRQKGSEFTGRGEARCLE